VDKVRVRFQPAARRKKIHVEHEYGQKNSSHRKKEEYAWDI
jgi:hypothetical protein